eukprot:scaffold26470_cov160-Isochrysis_galbana.AAC.2
MGSECMRHHHNHTNGPQTAQAQLPRTRTEQGALLGHWPEGSWRRDSVGHATERQTTRGKRSMAPKRGH